MFTQLAKVHIVAGLLISIASLATVRADFELVDDFDVATIGPVGGQNDWYAADATSIITIDPANEDNQVLAVTTDSTHLHHPLFLLNGTVRMLYLRFRFGGQQNFSFGMSGATFPDQFGDFEVELTMSSADNDLRILDDVNYESLIELAPNTWYNVWIFIDNLNDQSRVYLHTGLVRPADLNDLLDSDGQSLFVFRGGAGGDLRTFYIKTGGGSSGNSGPLYLDDIYLESTDALNLNNSTLIPPDFDDDGDIDFTDGERFVDCLNGPEVDTPPTGCTELEFALADLERDRDVDLRDFAAFSEIVDIPAE